MTVPQYLGDTIFCRIAAQAKVKFYFKASTVAVAVDLCVLISNAGITENL
jgi:hypothetical protein